jgi:hypothetical protein
MKVSQRGARYAAVLAWLLALQGVAAAQSHRSSGPTRSRDIRQVQATAEELPTPPPLAPGLNAPGPAESVGDLSVPAAERSFGGGEPTEALAAEEAEEEAEPTPLMSFLGMEDSPIKIYGWIQNSFTGNTNGNGTTRSNFGVNPNNQANEWMGNQYYLIFENPLELEDELNFGWRIDNLFGNDWSFNFMQGLLNNVFQPPGSFAGYDPAQFYGEVHLPIVTEGGIDVKAGRFYTLAGYEVVPAIGRPLLSVPYMFNYGQPFTHMGVMSTTHLTDRINLHNGIINGWDRFINRNYNPGYHGGFTWNSEDETWALAVMYVWGSNQYPRFLPNGQQIYPTGYIQIPSLAGRRNPNFSDNYRNLFTTVLTRKWNDKLTQVIETDQGFERNIPGLASPVIDGVVQNGAAKSAQWQSFGNWFLYSFTDKLTGVWRSEVFWDQQGARTAVVRDNRFKGDRYYEMTLGLIYKPHDWLWIRPEARYDWAQFGTPYTDGTRGSQFTLGFDVILLY